MADDGTYPTLPSPLVELNDDRFRGRGLRLSLRREDLIHPAVPGNKWRKLTPNLEVARAQGYGRLLTFGGAFSNHIAAVAAAGRLFGFETIGVIRGEEHLPVNPVLASVVADGMRLTYMDRATYRRKGDPEVVAGLLERFGDCYVVPEGGSNELAVRSCRAIAQEIGSDGDVICVAVGTGGTLAGIAAGLETRQRAVGFSSLKGGEFLVREVEALQTAAFGRRVGEWRIETGYHFGGYAKRPPELVRFIDDFHARHGITLDWVYVAKMLAGVFDLAQRGGFPSGSHVVAVVTGPPGPAFIEEEELPVSDICAPCSSVAPCSSARAWSSWPRWSTPRAIGRSSPG